MSLKKWLRWYLPLPAAGITSATVFFTCTGLYSMTFITLGLGAYWLYSDLFRENKWLHLPAQDEAVGVVEEFYLEDAPVARHEYQRRPTLHFRVGENWHEVSDASALQIQTAADHGDLVIRTFQHCFWPQKTTQQKTLESKNGQAVAVL